jgi:hypothetical protein
MLPRGLPQRKFLIHHTIHIMPSNFSSKGSAPPEIDVEKTFINQDIQSLLTNLTGMDLYGKVFRERNISKQERSHYALMTDNMFHDVIHSLSECFKFLLFRQSSKWKSKRKNFYSLCR